MATSSIEMSALRLLLDSSLFTKVIMGVLFLFSVISWTLVINKYFFLNAYRIAIAEFVKALTAQSRPTFLEESCAKFSAGPAKTMPVLLSKINRLQDRRQAVQSPTAIINNAITHEYAKLQEGMGLLASIANVSPLIGLLGTVWGVMYAFLNISQQGNASITTVAPGIAEALITTIAGLLVAIPALVCHNFLSGWIAQSQDALDRIGEFGLSLFNEG